MHIQENLATVHIGAAVTLLNVRYVRNVFFSLGLCFHAYAEDVVVF